MDTLDVFVLILRWGHLVRIYLDIPELEEKQPPIPSDIVNTYIFILYWLISSDFHFQLYCNSSAHHEA